ncbi:MAG: sugar phosphate isomerase/epimerase [Armatimonadetes bacterium]|nr:sugar phosphate isomerase/epimerase [Armatimonadota bacterium]MDW8027394.1 sugar phosphate isomerase/epimerase [Armatimonadota bacterium]
MAIKFAICNEIFQGWQLEKTFAFIRDVGYQGVEIAPFTLAERVEKISPKERKQLRKLAEKFELEIVGLHWLLVSPSGLHLTTPDDSVRERTKAYFRELIRFCSDLGGKIMVVGSPKQRSLVPNDKYEAAWERAKAFFADLLPMAQDLGVTLCIEALPNETDFIPTLNEAIRFVREINHPNLQTMVDVKSAVNEGLKLDEAVYKASQHLRHVHANDVNRLGPGMGDVDLTPLAKALKEVGYEGFVSVEVFDFSPGAERIAIESLNYLRKVFS